jgi:hypothetical protein
MADQGLDTPKALCQRAQLDIIQHSSRRRKRAGLKGDHSSETVHQLPCAFVLRVLRQSRVVNVCDHRVVGQKPRDLSTILVVLPHANGKRLDPTRDQK